MAKITVSKLNPAGSNLFEDSESFLTELTEQDTSSINGGRRPVDCSCGCTVITTVPTTFIDHLEVFV